VDTVATDRHVWARPGGHGVPVR